MNSTLKCKRLILDLEIRTMKHLTLFLICLFVNLGLQAQDKTQTLFSDENSYGGFGGPLVVFSNINGTVVGDVGGGGAFTVNNFFVGGYGLGNEGAQVTVEDEVFDIDFSHGGFWLGYAFKEHKLLHLYSSFRVGWGGVDFEQNSEKFFSDNLLALSPELGVELNVTNWFKLGLTAGYRAVSGIDNLPVLDNSDFTSMYGALTFRFGGFGDYHSYDRD